MSLIPQTIEAMIHYSKGNLHDVAHFMKVYAYARTIAELEGLDPFTRQTIEAAAIVHDIACPLCREKYGKASGPLQEKEGPSLAAELLRPLGWDEGTIAKVCFLVGHHHTTVGVDGPDWRILLEADFLVNADEGKASPEAIARVREEVFRSPSAIRLLDSIYQNVK